MGYYQILLLLSYYHVSFCFMNQYKIPILGLLILSVSFFTWHASVVVATCPSAQQLHLPLVSNSKLSSQRSIHVNTDHFSKKRYFLLGGNDPTNKGIGNLLVFFPAEFYFAFMSSRSIIIADDSLIGQMCKEIKCGFPLLSELLSISPHLFSGYSWDDVQSGRTITMNKVKISSKQNVIPISSQHDHLQLQPVLTKKIKTLHAMNFAEYSQDRSNLLRDLIVTATGYDAKSDWWIHSNKSALCISSYTGCDANDVECSEAFAFQQLIIGPFHGSTTKLTYANIAIQGATTSWISSIFVNFIKDIPKFDAAVHLRNQFLHFEMEFDASHPDYHREVSKWITSKDADFVFEAMITKLKELSKASINQNFTVYVAADNEEVKYAFIGKLVNSSTVGVNTLVQPVYIKGGHVYHVKNIKQLELSSKGYGMFNVVFDWIALSISRSLLAWRKEGTRAHSTFLSSARRFFHHKYEDLTLQLVKTKRGDMIFEPT